MPYCDCIVSPCDCVKKMETELYEKVVQLEAQRSEEILAAFFEDEEDEGEQEFIDLTTD